jgi:hypothetical protein
MYSIQSNHFFKNHTLADVRQLPSDPPRPRDAFFGIFKKKFSTGV